jgi:amino acid adenylation domain-containing protein
MGDPHYDGIAIIGMAGRFPGAKNIDAFWDNLLAGKESISFFTDAEIEASGLDSAALQTRGKYIPARGVLQDADCFDAAFFGVHPREAEVMDPQHRVFLEACWTALERAGYAPGQAPGVVGVFAGATFNTYYEKVLQRRPDLLELVGSDQVMLGNEKDYLATRVAYMLGLKGPALNISTACSTSLVAVCQACQALLTYQCDMVLAGGVSVTVPQQRGYYHDEGNIGSADGHTRTFDERASGTAFGNGVAVVVLKRLEEAVKDRDRIYAVIKGAALNNDGSQRVSFGAPGVEGQSRVIASAHALAGVDPETITCVEAHGTATPLGDPIEVAGLTRAFRMGTEAKQFCALGSVKTNVGHLDAAAGVTGLIKMALSLHNRVIPPSLHFKAANPKLDLANSPFYVNTTLQAWNPPAGVPRRAGVSAFGTGGTNAHIVLEEAPELPLSEPSRSWQLLELSAKTAEALDRSTSDLYRHLEQIAKQPDIETAQRQLADAAFTLQTGRNEFAHRRILTCQSPAEGAALLESRDPKRVFSHQQEFKEPPVVFMFPGQGAQYAGMGAELYQSEPVFRAEVDRCAEILKPILQADLRTTLFPDSRSQKEADRLLAQTRYTQPALFVIEYALARLWMSWGIKPAAMIGHSVGEYVAACLSGVFNLEDALSLVARRAALVQAQPGGAMLAVRLPAKDVLPVLQTSKLAIAAINSPNLCVVSGPCELVAALEKELQSRDVVARLLHTSHAFHSPMMDPVIAPFTDIVRTIKLGDPEIPYVSNVTARWITSAETRTPEYWASHVRQAVLFAEGVAELMKDSRNALLEVGPGQTLTTLARQHPARQAEQLVLASLLPPGSSEYRGILETLGRLWMTGVAVDWDGFYANERRCRAVLPTYPFERKRYWPEAPKLVVPAATEATAKTTSILPEAQPTPPDAGGALPRRDRLLAAVRSLVEDLSGYDLSAVDPAVDLLEMGLDSLLLTQASQLLQRKFGVSISFRQLMEELSSLAAIASHLDAMLPPEALAAAPSPSAVSTITSPVLSQNVVLEQLLRQQQQLTSQLLQLLGRQPVAAAALQIARPLTAAIPALVESKSHGPFKPFRPSADTTLSAGQRAALDSLVSRYTRRTAGSKKLAASNRPMLADPRSVAGFKQLCKEMVYPISTTRSDGSRVWDVDGNEYVDFVMGFGANLFGHRPTFVVRALHEQLDRGFEIGPMHPLAGEVAALLREFTGMERFGFTNTGSEAVLAATRISRTVTGRDKIAVFAGAYHGIFDEVLFRPLTINGETRTAPIAPGIPDSALEQVIVLDWANPQSLEILRARGSEIAAVLVEPVQSRRLDVRPQEFLRELRRVTEETGSALIFDEVVTGFRLHPGGAQSYFGVRADLATYGKVMGGGISIGVVAGNPKYMDALDGGKWQYGDTSFPEVGVTFFAGTFVRHPLALAAAKAVLTHLKAKGPGLQEELAARTLAAANQLRSIIGEFGAPYEVAQFSSLIQLGFPAEQRLAGLLFYMLRDRGIHIYENRAFVMTTSHSDADIARLATAFRESLAEMRNAGFIHAASVAASRPPAQDGLPVQTPSENSDPFPLTEAQNEIWLATQMSPDAALGYNESLKFDFRGDFDVDLFRAAVRQLLQRHPMLLATFSKDGKWQQIDSDLTVDVPLRDFSGEGEAAQERKVATIIDEAVSEPFDLTAGPLLRVSIARLSDEHHVVIWTAHHIVCDGWSGGLLVSELARIYSASKQGTAPALESPSSFREYARTALGESSGAESQMAYWRGQFSELLPPLDLPADRPRPLVRSGRASTAKRGLPAFLHKQLKRVAGQQRTTMVVVLMTGLRTLLYRLSGQRDIVIGLGVAGQAISGKSCLVGHCLNLLPIRTLLHEEESFLENLAAVKKGVLDAYEHHAETLGGILQNLRIPRSTGRPPVVEVIFNVDRDPGSESFIGLEFKCERNPKRALHFDLFFNFVEGPNGLCVECDYNTDLFDATTIDRWLGHYQTLLESISTNPSETLEKLPILTPVEARQLTVEWNDTRVEYDNPDTLNRWFESQVEKTPHAQAVTFEGRNLTYRELNQRANQLARFLKKLGVGPNVLVGLFTERSIEMVVGVFGILKAGGAYVPVDPEYPADRVSFMLQDAGAPVLLLQGHLADRLPRQEHARLIPLDQDWELIAREDTANLPCSTSPDDLAYMIYTSGSTGTPKGALNAHRGICNRLAWMQAQYQLTGADTVLQKTPFSFDVSVWEFFWPLSVGARLAVAKPGGHKDPCYLIDLISAERITVCHFVPSMLAAFLAEPEAGRCRGLRDVICSGEALPFRLQEEFFKLLPARLHNLYGPTEAAVDVTYWECQRESERQIVPIGRPVANTQIHILDRHVQPVPIGVSGELHIGGVQVGRGYYKRPDLTAEKFIQDPFSSGAGARLYKTGDLCRWLPEGYIEYLGRLDSQVKIRGFRIELGEVEAVLSRHKAVRQAAVVLRGDEQGDKVLVAYLQLERGFSFSLADLRAHLKKILPQYMIPYTFIPLKTFPLSPNGKIDQKALPPPGAGSIQVESEFVAPSDFLEQALVNIWSKVLRHGRVGLRDNFFDIGGHSIAAVRLLLEVRKLTGINLPLATLFQSPTVEALANLLRKDGWKPSWSSLVSIQPSGSRLPLFLIHGAEGNVLLYRDLTRYLGPDQPVYGLQSQGLNGAGVSQTSIQQMAAAYIKEITVVQDQGPYFLGGYCMGGTIAFEMAQQLSAMGEEVALVLLLDTYNDNSAPSLQARLRGPIHVLQNLWFHGRNFVSLAAQDRGKFLTEKIDIELSRTRLRLRAAYHAFRKPGGSEDDVLLRILRANHKAFLDYTPTTYTGRVAVIRPKGYFLGSKDPSFGWNKIVNEGLEIHVLPVYPKGMLIDPFCRSLAKTLKLLLVEPVEIPTNEMPSSACRPISAVASNH